jgi:hypothetical protein
MVTAVLAGLVVSLVLDSSPAAARRSHPPDLFRELFGPPVRLRSRAHQPRAAREKRANEKTAPEPKSATEPKPATEPEKAASEPKEPHETKEANELKVPLPQPRPAEAPKAEPRKAEPPKAEPDKPATAKTAPGGKDKPASQAATAAPTPAPTPEGPPPPSACRLALTEEIAIAPSVPDIHGPGGCGGEDLVRLESIVLPDKHRVSMKPAATMRCGMAAAVADWVRTDVQPLVQGMGTEATELENYDAYECRGRNGVSGAPLSEHGRANAIDVHAFKLANGQSLGLTDRNVPRAARESVLSSVCARFTTVLGPGSDGYHEDHIHLDLLQRHNNYKICQWNVWDPMPQIAPLMPEVRPDDAPPRRVADKDDGDKPQDAKSSGGKNNGSKGDDGKAARAPTERHSRGDKADEASESRSGSGKSKSGKSESGKSESSKSEKGQSAASKSKSGKVDKSEPDDEPATKKRRHGHGRRS